MGSFDFTYTLVTLLGIGGLVLGSRRYLFLNVVLRSNRFSICGDFR